MFILKKGDSNLSTFLECAHTLDTNYIASGDKKLLVGILRHSENKAAEFDIYLLIKCYYNCW